jgi:hypothetical protein
LEMANEMKEPPGARRQSGESNHGRAPRRFALTRQIQTREISR